MKFCNPGKVKVGYKLPELMIRPITNEMLTLYANASGDYNPIHLDKSYAQRAGLPDVIAHGMLIMSFLGQALINNIEQAKIKEYGVQFSSITKINDILICNGSVSYIHKVQGADMAHFDLKVTDNNGNEKLVGYSKIILN
ncbi:MAG: MaoC/PaaZ C-terminal domain-containing protein [Candidatus Neomarinimicrobiota bacterium]